MSKTPTARSQPPSERPEDDLPSASEEIAEESAAPRRAGRWRWAIGIVVSIFFLWVAFRQVSDVGHLAEALGSANYLWLAPAVALYLLGLLVRGLRWRILLLPIARIPTGSLFGILSIGFLVNNVLPARLGEIARAILVGRRHDISRSAALATIVVERIFDGVVMLLFLGVASATAGARVAPDWLELLVPLTAAAFGGAGIALAVLALAPTFALGLAARLLAPFPPRLRASALSVANKFITGLGVLQDLELAAGVLATSIVAWLLEMGAYVSVGQAFRLTGELNAYLLALAVANLGTMIPSSPGYVGTFDALVQRSLAVFAVPAAPALAYAFVLHLAIWLPPTLMGFFYLWRYNLSLSRLTRE
ncbi:MAG TPA: lysylphosphatidylglycerol synthase transmembrane domain-containing protein [Chloroflexota bacterium]